MIDLSTRPHGWYDVDIILWSYNILSYYNEESQY